MPRRNISAVQTALLSLAGAAVASLCFVLIAFDRKLFPHNSTGFWLTAAGSLLLLCLGFQISLRAESDLKNGIASNRWPAPKIDSLRRLIQSPGGTIIFVLLLIFYVANFITGIVPNGHSTIHPIGFVGFLFAMTLSRLRNAVSPPGSDTPRSFLNWRKSSPLHSDHWGQR